jgi:hypothetical protein
MILWNEVNVEECKLKRISKELSSVQIMINETQLENVDYFNRLGCMINDVRYTRESKSIVAMAKAAVKKKTGFPAKCYIWTITLYGAETWTLREVDQV